MSSLVITTFPEDQGEFMLKHLSDEVLNVRGRTKQGYEYQINEIKKEIEIKDDIL
jgi:hypothetical protein